jgi:hypothetical protein
MERLAAASLEAQMRRIAEDTRELGGALLANLPLGLLRVGEGPWPDEILRPAPPAPARLPVTRPGSATKKRSPRPPRPGKIRGVRMPLEDPRPRFIPI